jgi:hypothetical protein
MRECFHSSGNWKGAHVATQVSRSKNQDQGRLGIGFLFHCKRIIHIVKQAGLLVHNASAGSERSYLHHTVTLIGSFVPSHEYTHSTCLRSKHVMHHRCLRSHAASDKETLIGPRRSGANECAKSSLPGRTSQVDAILKRTILIS